MADEDDWASALDAAAEALAQEAGDVADVTAAASWPVIVTIVLFAVALIGAVLYAAAYALTRRPQQTDPDSSTVALPDGRTLSLPSARYVDAMRAHVERQREALAATLRSGELKAAWSSMPEAERRKLLVSQRAEVSLAVGGFIGGSTATLTDACPELSDECIGRYALPREGREEALPRLLTQVAEGRLPDAKGGAYEVISAAAAAQLKAEAAAGGGGGGGGSAGAAGVAASAGSGRGKAGAKSAKEEARERAVRGGYVQLLRRSCLVAFAIAVCSELGVNARKEASDRSASRRAFFAQLVRGACIWALGALAMRHLPDLLASAGEGLF